MANNMHVSLLKDNKIPLIIFLFFFLDASTIAEVKKLRISMADFEVKDVIGRGHFGEVQVVREKASGTVYALKTLHKHETLAQHEVCQLMALY